MTPRLDPQAQALLEVMSAGGAPQPYALSLEQAREQMRSAFVSKGEPISLHSVENFSLPTPQGGLGLRVYRPGAGVRPVALFLHGGGWTLNDLDTHDRLCRRISRRSGWLVAALDFRRAPEHRHPAQLEDAHLAYRWLHDNASRLGSDPSQIALVGESSGGATAACLALLLRDLGAPQPTLQVLVYPIVDMSDRWPSYEEHGSGYILDARFVRWSLENYLPPGHDPSDPYLFPLSAETLSGVAPTLLLTAEFDPLRDGGIAFARKLTDAGVSVEHVHVEDQMHGFLLLDRAIEGAGASIDLLADALARHSKALLSAL